MAHYYYYYYSRSILWFAKWYHWIPSMTLGGRTVSSPCVVGETMKAQQKGYRKKGAEGAQREARERGGKSRRTNQGPVWQAQEQAPYTHCLCFSSDPTNK